MPDPNPAPTLVKLAVKFLECQAKRVIGEGFVTELVSTLTEYAGEDVTARLTDFFSDRAEKINATFRTADDCFARKADLYAQLIRSQPFAQIESLEKLATALPDTIDHARLLDALRQQFLSVWHGQLSDAQATDAATIYADCLIRAFAATFENDLPLLNLIVDKLDHIRSTTDKTLEIAERLEARVTGAHAWRRPSAAAPRSRLCRSRKRVGRCSQTHRARHAHRHHRDDSRRARCRQDVARAPTHRATRFAISARRHFPKTRRRASHGGPMHTDSRRVDAQHRLCAPARSTRYARAGTWLARRRCRAAHCPRRYLERCRRPAPARCRAAQRLGVDDHAQTIHRARNACAHFSARHSFGRRRARAAPRAN